MILADMSVPPEILGWAVISVGAVLVIVDRVKKFFWPTVPTDQEAVRRAEFQELKSTLGTYVTRIELSRLEHQLQTLTNEHKELKDYTYARVHDLSEKVHEIRLKIETMHMDLNKNIELMSTKILDRVETVNRAVLMLEASFKNSEERYKAEKTQKQ